MGEIIRKIIVINLITHIIHFKPQFTHDNKLYYPTQNNTPKRIIRGHFIDIMIKYYTDNKIICEITLTYKNNKPILINIVIK